MPFGEGAGTGSGAGGGARCAPPRLRELRGSGTPGASCGSGVVLEGSGLGLRPRSGAGQTAGSGPQSSCGLVSSTFLVVSLAASPHASSLWARRGPQAGYFRAWGLGVLVLKVPEDWSQLRWTKF